MVSPTSPLGCVIVGCGMIARFHARAIADVPQLRLVGLVSRSEASARKMADELGQSLDVFTDLGAALARRDVAIIIITTPSGAHQGPAVAAARAGKHIVVEKPLEITTERCDAIIRACHQNRVQLCTIFPSRFGDANVELKRAVEAGRFGRLTLGETTCKWWRSQAYYDEGGWKGTQALDGGGALMNQAIHNVDLLQWMMGPVEQVMAFTAMLAHERIEVEDTAVACLRFRSGALGVIQATTSVHPGLPKTIAVHGDKGTVVIEQDDVLRWDFAPETADDGQIKARFAQKVGASGGSSNPAAISHQGHARQLADFAQAIREGRPPLVDGREGRKAVAIIQAIYASASAGRAAVVDAGSPGRRPQRGTIRPVGHTMPSGVLPLSPFHDPWEGLALMLAVCRSLLALTLLLLLAAAGCKKPQDATPDKANLELQLPETADPPSWAADRVSRLKIDGKDYSEPRGTKRLLEVKPGEANEVTVVYTFWPNTYTKIIRTKVVKLDPTKRTVASLLTEDPATPDQIQPIYVPTPEETVEQMCEMAKIGKDDVVYDIGCGDGRLVIMAVQKFGAKKAVGIDIDADLIKLCKKNAEKAGVSDKVTFEAKDAQKIKDFSEASVVLLYIGDYLGEALRPTLRGTLKKGARIVSNRFKMGDWRPDRSELIKHKDNTSKHELHLWTIK